MAARWMLRGLLVVFIGATLMARTAGRAETVDPALKIEAPEISGGIKWLNSKPLKLANLRGKVVLIDFWEYTCVNCIRTMPYLRSWHEKYADKGLVIIGVHTPEFAFARLEENVAQAAKKFDLKYPLVVDSNYAIWTAYSNRFWPAKYLVDKDGLIRYFHFGEGAYGSTEKAIQDLLKEANPKVKLPDLGKILREEDKRGAVCYPVTPELYAGWMRGGRDDTLGNKTGYKPGKVGKYKDPGQHEDGSIYLQGRWKNEREALVSVRKSTSPKDYIAIRYHALQVNAVLKPEAGTPIRVWVYHDGDRMKKEDAGADIKFDSLGRSYIIVDEPRMYNIVKNAKFAQRELKLAVADPGLGLYAFTFVSCVVPD